MLVEDAIYEALTNIHPDFNYVFENENGAEPKPPYVLISKLPDMGLGVSQRIFVNKENKEVIINNKNVGFRLTLHAKNTDPQQDEFEYLNAIMESDLAVSNFYQNGLGLTMVGDTTYVPTPVDTTMYQRQVFDLRFNIQYITEVFAHHIKEVNVDAKLANNLEVVRGDWVINREGEYLWDDSSVIPLEQHPSYDFKINVKEEE